MIKFFLAALFFSTTSFAGTEIDYDQVVKNMRSTLEKFVGADTTNPPGNESKIVKIVSEKLKAAGIPFEISEFMPGSQNIVARLKGSGSAKAALYLAHIDVVGTANQKWTVPDHKVTEKDGYLYGRGVEDDLGMAALGIETLIAIKNSGIKLKRDIVVALTGHEESDGEGIQYILKNNPSSLDSAFALNEGGNPVLEKDGGVRYISLQVAEKTYQNFELVATGTTGHSSVPLADNAIYKISRALEKLGNYKRPARLIPATRAYFEALSKIEKPPLSTAMAELAKSKGKISAKVLAIVEADPKQAANLRTTCVATMISGGTRVNALPAEAKANINCRILPDETQDQIEADLNRVIHDPTVQVSKVPATGGFPASPVDGEGVAAIKKVAEKIWPGVVIVPSMSRGATDSKFLRGLKIPAYGLNPIAMTDEDARRAHGIDERIPVGSLKTAAQFLAEFFLEVARE